MAPSKRTFQVTSNESPLASLHSNKSPSKRTRNSRKIVEDASDDEALTPPPGSSPGGPDVANSPNEDDDQENSESPEQTFSNSAPSGTAPSTSDVASPSRDIDRSDSDDAAPSPDDVSPNTGSGATLHSSNGFSGPPTTVLRLRLVGGTTTSSQHDQDTSTDGTNGASSPPDDTTDSEPTSSLVDGAPVVDEMLRYDIRSDFDETLKRRLEALLTYSNAADSVYSLSCLPLQDMTWGSTENHTANKLCIRGNPSVPVTTWITALIDRLYMFETDGGPKKKVTVALSPLTEHSLRVGYKIQKTFSKPAETIDTNHRRLYASRWQTVRLPRQREMEVVPFRECYDARSRYQVKSNMDRVDVEDLNVGDVVLVEAHITRFSTVEALNKQKTWQEQARARKKGFVEYKSMFELSSISLLKSIPDELVRRSPVPSSRPFSGFI
ncbi:uncharacterized protein STEHIDRAFT_163999 [Stereum hirsutum FP-91666 SS1]|uniref:Uncharacterized protein n=1 Tax=Stereum hirsutum (strain FP-91666) TaxID=721885 RepID=R7RXK8_STEHR|nr:uncharacterized protein STEHIDRAFT_163999 [Stereum hirsutum FP-91666 SS1]EIM79107.1 hypothetical protein STEHIDRAFT_163999 [Stereum hirsutum FP-91666 SS1]